MSSKRRRNENKYDLVAKLVNVINIVTSSSNTVKARFPRLNQTRLTNIYSARWISMANCNFDLFQVLSLSLSLSLSRTRSYEDPGAEAET